MPRRSLTGSRMVTSLPSTVSLPDVASIIRLIIRMDVVLPHPDGPTNTASVPLGTSRVSLSTATVPSGYSLVTSSKVIMRLLLQRFVEAVVLYPFSCRLIWVDAGVAGYPGVQVDKGRSGQLGRHRIEDGLQLIGFL